MAAAYYTTDVSRRETPLPEGSFGERLRRFRKSLGLSQDDFAAEIGISRHTVIRMEHGVTPETNTLQALHNKYGNKAPQLEGLSDPSAKVPPPTELAAGEHGGLSVHDPLIQGVVQELLRVPVGRKRAAMVARVLAEIARGPSRTVRGGRGASPRPAQLSLWPLITVRRRGNVLHPRVASWEQRSRSVRPRGQRRHCPSMPGVPEQVKPAGQ